MSCMGTLRRESPCVMSSTKCCTRRCSPGAKIAFLMFQHFQIADLDNAMLELSDLLVLELKGDNIRAFGTAWGDTLIGMETVPDEEYFENVYRRQVKTSKQFGLL